MKKSPHANAAKVFINWFLSKEGAMVTAKAYDRHSVRLDVPTEGINELNLRQLGARYISGEREDMYLKTPDYSKIAEEIFSYLLR